MTAPFLFFDLCQKLKELATETDLVALKSGTEVEDMGFEEIGLLRKLSSGIVPLYVKIGGAEARNDIRHLAALGVDGLIAPMIESPYALQKFVEALEQLLTPDQYQSLLKGINIETVNAVKNLQEILKSREIGEITQITAARSDLSASMQLEADHPQVIESCAQIVRLAKEQDLRTSVGGGIQPQIVPTLLEQVGPDYVNTRHLMIDCKNLQRDAAETIKECIHFELELYRYLATQPSRRKEHYQKRVAIIRERIVSMPGMALNSNRLD